MLLDGYEKEGDENFDQKRHFPAFFTDGYSSTEHVEFIK
jgi:hypothetical protein